MADHDFEQLQFHKLEALHHDKLQVSELIGFEGYPCLDCKEACPGFVRHPWRHGCGHCKCPPLRHEILSKNLTHPFLRMNVEEHHAPHPTEYEIAHDMGYAWVPRGLDHHQIEKYMSKLENHQVPNLKGDGETIGHDGIKYRDFQLVNQLPLQDFHFHELKFIEKNSESVFKWLNKKRLQDAVGVGAVKAELSHDGHCSGCDFDIPKGDMAVFTERLGAHHYYHPQCFKCAYDGENLVDMIYFAKNDQIYCGRHYHEQTKPRCFGCDELIIKGGYIKAMEENWHAAHFCCWDCDTNLSGEKYIPFEGHPFCEGCYNKRNANICTICNDYIGIGYRDLQVRDNHYHEHCFVCSHCNNLLENGDFSYLDDNLICHHCRGVDIEKSKYCHLCMNGYKNGDKKVGVSGEYFHEWCFCCTECQDPIGAKTFVRKDEHQLCNECFNTKFAKICDHCDVIIKGPILSLDERFFHANCFLCYHCKEHLGVSHDDDHDEVKGVQFYKQEGEPYCLGCWLELFAKRCNDCDCGKPLAPNSQYVEYEEKFWHKECFTCSACHLELAGGVKFVNRYGDRFCMDCK